tara:strand:+ start:20773 stop:21207 length:435 start_codon:yes stop_codon:yes gene_type:complete
MPQAIVNSSHTLPIAHESSVLRSPRDSDDSRKQWKRARVTNSQADSHKQAIQALSIQLEKIRRRILGGSSSKPASGMIFRGEYSADLSYSPQEVVVIRSGPNAGSYVCILANDSTDPQNPIVPDTNGLYWISLTGNVTSMGQWL